MGEMNFTIEPILRLVEIALQQHVVDTASLMSDFQSLLFKISYT